MASPSRAGRESRTFWSSWPQKGQRISFLRPNRLQDVVAQTLYAHYWLGWETFFCPQFADAFSGGFPSWFGGFSPFGLLLTLAASLDVGRPYRPPSERDLRGGCGACAPGVSLAPRSSARSRPPATFWRPFRMLVDAIWDVGCLMSDAGYQMPSRCRASALIRDFADAQDLGY